MRRPMDQQISSLVLGILGNVIQVLVFASPLPTFRQIIKMKSTESFSSIPYITTLLSNCLWLYYGLLKPNETLIASISAVGVCFQIVYICIYLIFALKTQRVYVARLLLVIGVLYGIVSFSTLRFTHGNMRIIVVGIFCATNSACMYASPLTVVGLVIKTKSVKYMPFWLSFFLSLSAFVWLAFALVNNDPFLMASNSIGSIFGILQLALYAYYSRTDNGLEYCKHMDIGKTTTKDLQHDGPKTIDSELGLKRDQNIVT